MDFTTTKVDFYKNYKGNNYESFYENEITSACDVISAGGASNLLEKVESIKDTLTNITLEWYDEVEKEFQTYRNSCTAALDTIIDSINSQFISSAETAYKNLKTELENLKTANSTYQTEFDSKPDESSYKVTDEDGNVTTSPQYSVDLESWKTKVNEAGKACVDIIAKIEEHKNTLKGVNQNTITIEGTSPDINMSSLEFELPPTNNLNLAGPVETYIAINGSNYLINYSNWGQNFYALANIKRGGPEEPDHCISWANAYAKNILNRNNTPHTGIISYSTMDKQEAFGIAAKEILSGRPVVLEVTGVHNGDSYVNVPVVVNGTKTVQSLKTWNRHYVTLYGIRQGADLGNLKDTDFLYLDPAGGQVKQLGTENGGQHREILNAQAATTHESDENYCINVFSDQYNYASNSYTCERLNRILDWDSNKTNGGVQYIS